MPDWNLEEYAPLKNIVEKYFYSLNGRDFESLRSLLCDKCILSRGHLKSGKGEVVSWLEKLLSNGGKDFQFKVLDATAGFFSTDEAQILVYTKIFDGDVEKEIFIESLYLERVESTWLISKIFGLTFEPEHYEKYFG